MYKRQVNNRLLAVLGLPVILHDIGKILPVYQIRPSNWGYGYKYHEVVGAIVVDKLLDAIEDKLESISDEVEELPYGYLKTLVVAPILLHHYAFREVQEKQVILFFRSRVHLRDYRVINGSDIKSLLEEVLEKSISLQTDYRLHSLLKELIASTNQVGDIVIDRNSISRLFENIFGLYRARGVKTNYSIEIYVSVITGVVSIADYIAGSLARSGCKVKGYPLKILSSREIGVLKNTICRSFS